MAVTASAQGRLDSLAKRFDDCKQQDTNKCNLIEDLFSEIDGLKATLADTELQLRQKSDLVTLYSERADIFGVKASQFEQEINKHSFVSVVIDGDNMPFLDKFVRAKRDGGLEAARLLKQAVEENLLDLPPNSKTVVISLFLNLKGLARTYRDAQAVDSPLDYEDFVAGFNLADPLCNAIDVGHGKENADKKVEKMFEMHIADVHCRRVYLGGLGDGGYNHVLRRCSTEGTFSQRITLIEGTPFARDVVEFKNRFSVLPLHSIFRREKLVTRERLPLVSTIAAYSSIVAAPAPPAAATQSERPTPGESGTGYKIIRNRQGQRVDSLLRYQQHEFQTLKSMKLCNNYHLTGKCPFANCIHDHEMDLSEKQLVALRAVARLSPCPYGVSCTDKYCIAGHRCQRDPCRMLDCRFPQAMHGIDQTPIEV